MNYPQKLHLVTTNKLSIQDSRQVKWWFGQTRKSKKECVWAEIKQKTLVLVLGGEKQYAVQLETLTSKKSSHNQEISKDFEKLLLSEEFKEENECQQSNSKGKQKKSPLDISPGRLRIKYKFLRKQWKNHVKMASRKAAIGGPKWFTILNPIFPHTMEDVDAASSPSESVLHCALIFRRRSW